MSSVMVQVFFILYMAFAVVIEELCRFPLLFLCVVPFGTYLNDDEDIDILVELASCFCKSEFNGFVINKVFECLNNAVGIFSIVYNYILFCCFMRSSL